MVGRLTLITLFLLLLQPTMTAQVPSVAVGELTVNDGLSQGFVTAFCQDNRGFMWIGTTNGLNRYDGYQVQTFSGSTDTKWSLGDPAITCLATDGSGLLWIGTESGLYILEPESGRFLAFSTICPQLPAESISGMHGRGNGAWFISVKSDDQTSGLYRLAVPATLKAAIQQDAWGSVHPGCTKVPPGIAVQLIGAIADTVLLLKNKSEQLFYYTETENAVRAMDLSMARRLSGSATTVLWTGQAGYFFKSDESGQTVRLFPPGKNAVFFRQGKAKTYCYLVTGVHLFEVENEGPAKQSTHNQAFAASLQLPMNLVQTTDFGCPLSRALFTDKSGNVWIGTNGYGARIIKLNRNPFEHFLPNYSAFNFRLIDSTRVWMGKTHPNDLFHLKTKKIEPAPWSGKLPKKFHANNVLPDQAGNCWFTGQLDSVSRVVVLKKNSAVPEILPAGLKNYSYVAEQLFLDKYGNIWVGAHDGICLRFRPGAWEPEWFSYRNLLPPNLKGLRCNAIVQIPGGDLFIGTSQGLIRVTDPNGRPAFRLFLHDPGDPASLIGNPVLTLHTDARFPNILWIGTQGGGLDRLDLDAGRQFVHFTEADGLLNNVVYGILTDTARNLWLSTNRGISLYNPSTGACNNFQKSDGLPASEFNTGAALQLADGQLLFGSVNGLIFLHPRAFRLPSYPIPVAVTNVSILGTPNGQASARASKDAPPGNWQNMQLKSNQNNLIFEFAGLDFNNPATNRYHYRLLGLNDQWINNGNLRTANYSGLPPGEYTFEVQAATAFGNWPAESAQVRILIRPPWYRSGLAYLAYGLLGILAVLLYSRFRKKQKAMQKAAETTRQESLRLRELDAFKNRILANITHEFRTPITLILGLAERLYLSKTTDSATISANILQQGENLLDLLNQITDLSSLNENRIQLQVRQGDISSHIRYVTESLRSLAAEKSITLTFHSEAPGPIMDFDPERLRQVIVNLLTNAIRHTPPQGLVTVRLSGDDANSFMIRISDTGEGISKDELPHIFERFYQADSQQHGSSGLGLALTKDLVSLMGGTISAESEPGFGSIFIVRLPVTHNAAPEDHARIPDLAEPAIAMVSRAGADQKPDAPLIVVIEDNRVISNYLVSCLAPAFNVWVADDGDSGIAAVTEMVPDLVITDLTMPGKHGFDVVRILKAQEITSHIPIVILSATVAADDRITGRRMGADAFLSKPFREEELLLVIKNLLDLRVLWQRRYARISGSISPASTFPPDMQEAVKKEDAFMAKIHAIFEEYYTDEAFSLDDLCQALGYSKSKLQRKLASLTNQPAMHMLRSFRLQKAYDLLQNNPEMNVSAVCFQVGFSSISHFSRMFSKKFNKAPSEVRSGPK